MNQKGEMKTTDILFVVVIVSLALTNFASYKYGWHKGWDVAYKAGVSWGRIEGRRASYQESFWNQCSREGDLIKVNSAKKYFVCIHANGIKNTMVDLRD